MNDQEREELRQVVKKLGGTSQKVKRAQVLLKADADGPAWPDTRIADAFGRRTKTIENIRQRLVEQDFRDSRQEGIHLGPCAAVAGRLRFAQDLL